LAQLVPVLIVYVGVDKLPRIDEGVEIFVLNVTSAYMIVVAALTIVAILNAANAIYESNPRSRQRPIKGFIQLVQLVVMVLGVLLFIAAVLDRSPVLLLSGFGAMTAVLLLAFKDTLLSFVASIQLSTQDLVRVGDWIEVPQFGADGDVVDVALHTVKIQNWDKTITTIPTHRLISDSFKNWRGMSVSGGRRIKLRQHPQIRQDMTLMVRHLSPGPQGIPIEVYCFTATTVWAEYEAIQADIFDHLMAIVPEFGLRLFQQPAGTEFSVKQA